MNNVKMIFGAPGCGKTTYLITLLQELLKSYEPDEIAFVSFTKKGSYEGRDRAIEKFDLSEEDFPYFRTIHSIAFRELHRSKYDMISRRHYKDFSKAMGMNFLGYYTEDLINNDDQYLFGCSLKKNNTLSFQRFIEGLNYPKFRMIESNYERFKKEMGVIDFDDLILDFIKEDKPLPVKVAIIDEAQDLTSLQWSFCEVAFRNCEKIYIAGDDDQAIYEWSGADVHRFLSFTKKSDILILDKSYRLKENILNFSKTVSQRISERVDKQFAYSFKGGEIRFYNRFEDITINNEESYYFLSRNNYYLKPIKDFLYKMGVVFESKKEPSVNRAKYNAIRKYEELRKHAPDQIRKNIQVLPFLRKDVSTLVPWFNAFEMDLWESNYYRDLFKNKTNIEDCKITVSTIHGVKGGEADNVVVLLNLTKSVYQNLNSSQELLDSELRCLYVALTRAKKNLHIIYSNSKMGYDNILNGGLDGNLQYSDQGR